MPCIIWPLISLAAALTNLPFAHLVPTKVERIYSPAISYFCLGCSFHRHPHGSLLGLPQVLASMSHLNMAFPEQPIKNMIPTQISIAHLSSLSFSFRLSSNMLYYALCIVFPSSIICLLSLECKLQKSRGIFMGASFYLLFTVLSAALRTVIEMDYAFT